MISYRPILELTATGRMGFWAAIAAMALAAVLGTASFASVEAATIDPSGVQTAAAAVLIKETAAAEQAIVRRQDSGGSL